MNTFKCISNLIAVICRYSAHYLPPLSILFLASCEFLSTTTTAECTHCLCLWFIYANVRACEWERDDCHLLEHEQNAAKRAQTDRQTDSKRSIQKRRAKNRCKLQWESGKWRKGYVGRGQGRRLNLFKSISQCGIGFDRVVSALGLPTFALKFKLIQFSQLCVSVTNLLTQFAIERDSRRRNKRHNNNNSHRIFR